MSNKGEKSSILLVILGVIVVVCGLGYFIYTNYFNENKIAPTDKNYATLSKNSNSDNNYKQYQDFAVKFVKLNTNFGVPLDKNGVMLDGGAFYPFDTKNKASRASTVANLFQYVDPIKYSNFNEGRLITDQSESIDTITDGVFLNVTSSVDEDNIKYKKLKDGKSTKYSFTIPVTSHIKAFLYSGSRQAQGVHNTYTMLKVTQKPYFTVVLGNVKGSMKVVDFSVNPPDAISSAINSNLNKAYNEFLDANYQNGEEVTIGKDTEQSEETLNDTDDNNTNKSEPENKPVNPQKEQENDDFFEEDN